MSGTPLGEKEGLHVKKIITATVLGGALLIGGLGVGTAQAEPPNFSYESMEVRMCQYLDNHPTLQGFSNLSYGAWAAGWPRVEEGIMAGKATRDICPQYHDLAMTWANMSPTPAANPSDVPQFPPFSAVH
jgi:hypothetical protein